MSENFFETAMQHFDRGDTEAALPLLTKAAADQPTNSRVVFALGVCHFRRKDYASAEKYFHESTRLNEQDHNAHYYLGLVSERLNRMEEARMQYQTALRLKPDFPEARQKLGISSAPPVAQASSAPVAVQHAPKLPQAQMPQRNELEQLRDPGELIHSGRRRMRSFNGTVLLMVLAFVATVVVTVTVANSRSLPDREMASPCFFIGIGFCVFLLFVMWLRSFFTRYVFFERRIDFRAGLLFRKVRSLWIYQTEDVWLTRAPLDLLTGDATVHILAHGVEPMHGRVTPKGSHFLITGLGNAKHMEKLWVEIRDAAIVERRGMKNWFI